MVKYKQFIIVIVLLFIFIYLFFATEIKTIAVFNIISAILLTIGVFNKQGTLLSPFLLILISLYVFHSGHLWLSLFYANPIQFLSDFGYASSTYEFIAIYGLLSRLLILYGLVGLLLLKIKKPRQYFTTSQYIPSRIFTIIVDTAFLIMMYFEVGRAINVSHLGYGEGYLYPNAFATLLSDWVDILLVLMMFVFRDNRKVFLKYAGMLIIRALFIMFFVGNRGASMISLIVLLFIFTQYSYLRMNKKRIRRIVIGFSVFILVALPLISFVRQGVSTSDAFSENGPITAFLIEFGDTARNMFLVDGFLAQSKPLNGLQILATSLTIIPFSTALFGDIIHRYGFVAIFLNDYFNIKGLGGSMFAQLYFNFGDTIWLYISTCLIALVSVLVSNRLVCKNNSLYQIIICLSLFVGLMSNVRGEWYSTMSHLKIALYLCLLLFLFKREEIKIADFN